MKITFIQLFLPFILMMPVFSAAQALNVQVGPRPYFLISQMKSSALKTKLESCSNKPLEKTDFSIGHRGAALMFPEHTKESYEAAARMGAGVIECDQRQGTGVSARPKRFAHHHQYFADPIGRKVHKSLQAL